jgi:hypothetical protein
MKKQYKHIKSGVIAQEEIFYYEIESKASIPKWMIEDNKDWEEVKVKVKVPLYEILTMECKWSGVHTSAGDIIANEKGNGCNSYNEHTHIIDSVKRLSDGVIFKRNDTVVRHADSHCLTPNLSRRDILYIYTKPEEQMNMYFNTNSKDSFTLSCFSHTEPCLIIAEDGVKVYNRDKVFYVTEALGGPHEVNFCKSFATTNHKFFGFLKSAKKYITKNKVIFVSDDGINMRTNDMYFYIEDNTIKEEVVPDNIEFYKGRPTVKRFSYKDNALKCLINETPCLSIKDVDSILRKGKSYQYHSTTINSLTDLVKSMNLVSLIEKK